MHRFYVRGEDATGDMLTLSARESHHATHVLRLRSGDRAVVLTGCGEEIAGEVDQVRRGGVTVRVMSRRKCERGRNRLILVQALVKGKAMETIVQKATELGADRIVPVLTERSVPDFSKAVAIEKLDRWMGVAVEAIKQCGGLWLPEIETAAGFEELIAKPMLAELELVASLDPDAWTARRRFEAFVADQGRLPRSVSVWIGPEGDFTLAEIERMRARGIQSMTLGQHVLRSDTAAVCALALVQQEWVNARMD